MSKPEITLADRYDLSKHAVLLNGTQALVRLMMEQKERDRAAGLNTSGFVTGYRGSPLGAVDMQMQRAEKQLTAHDVVFQSGLNEDLAATALWGAQQAELYGEGKYDGVFWHVVWQRPWCGSVGRCVSAREHGRHVKIWRCSGLYGG